MPKRLFTVKEACSYLAVSASTLYRMIDQKELVALEIGGRTLFDAQDLDTLIEKAKTAGQELVRKKGRKGRPRKQVESLAGHKKSIKPTRSKRQK